jgi:hypothetical protein
MFLPPLSIISTEKDFGAYKVYFVLRNKLHEKYITSKTKNKLHEKYITSKTKKSSGVPFSNIYIMILNLTEK